MQFKRKVHSKELKESIKSRESMISQEGKDSSYLIIKNLDKNQLEHYRNEAQIESELLQNIKEVK